MVSQDHHHYLASIRRSLQPLSTSGTAKAGHLAGALGHAVHLLVVELVAHDTVALRVKSCNSRRVIRDFLVKRSVHLFVLSARLGTTLQERPTQGTARELPSP